MAFFFEKRGPNRCVIAPIIRYPYPAHLHEVVEIVLVRRGQLNMKVNGKDYMLTPNCLVAIFPYMIHSYLSVSEDAEGLFVGIVPELIAEYEKALTTQWPVEPFIRILPEDQDLTMAADKLEAFMKEKEKNPLTQAYVHLYLSCLFTKLKLVPASEMNQNHFLFDVMYYVQEHATENLTLESVAKAMGVGKSHLSHLFSQKLQINFRVFLNTIRIDKACAMLQEKAVNIKQVSYECGFENTRTFHRVFQESQKMTPGEYRERMLQGYALRA